MIQPTVTPKIFIDLRQEVYELFYGTSSMPGFSFEVIVRHVDKNQRCTCWNHLKKEVDIYCKKCKGKGWLVYDKIYRTVKRKYVGKEEVDQPGLYEVDTSMFFFEHTVPITHSDTIIEVATGDTGNILSPVKYLKQFSIKDVEVMRGNNGRAEFTKIYGAKAE